MTQDNGRNDMTAEDDLNAAFALLHAGCPKHAKPHFRHIWNRQSATPVDRYVALTGITNCMDALGQFYEAETVWVNGLTELRQTQQRQIARSRPVQQSRSGSGLFWAVAGVVALAVITS